MFHCIIVVISELYLYMKLHHEKKIIMIKIKKVEMIEMLLGLPFILLTEEIKKKVETQLVCMLLLL